MAQHLGTLTILQKTWGSVPSTYMGLRAECDSVSRECDILSVSSEGSKHIQYAYVRVDRIHS